MSQMILEPGQSVLVQTSSDQGRSTYQAVSYEEVLSLLVSKSKSSSRRSINPMTKASRTVGLLGRAIITGTWSTGAAIDRDETFDKLIQIVRDIDDPYQLTDSARGIISGLIALRSDVSDLERRQSQLKEAYRRGRE